MHFASVYRAPVLLNIVNNQWAISSFAGVAGAEQATFAARALAYGLPGLRVEGNDFLAVHTATTWAADRAYANLGATVIEFFTYRGGAFDERRPAEVPGRWRGGEMAARRSDRPVEDTPDRARRVVR